MRSTKLFLISLPLLAAGSAYGQIIFNNVQSTVDGSDSIFSFGPLADSFSVGSSAATFSGVVLSLENPNADAGSLTVSLLSDTGAPSPGSVLESTVVSESLITPGTLLDVTLGSLVLSANTRYWIQLSDDTSGGGVSWDYSGDISGPGVATEFFSNANGVFPNSQGPYMMEVTPEPSSFAYLGLGLLPFVLRRRKRA